MDITKLKGYLPARIYDQLPAICQKFEIDGPRRLSHLIGQTKHESSSYTQEIENLNYSGVVLWKLFHKYFASQEEANDFARQPERIANRIYANRLGNGDEASGDGWKYRGRGDLQLTGRDNYNALSEEMGLDFVADPSLVVPAYSMSSAAFFFKHNDLWTICDKGVDDATIKKVTKRINAGLLGLADRTTFTKKAYALLHA
jgi:putative chitinase